MAHRVMSSDELDEAILTALEEPFGPRFLLELKEELHAKHGVDASDREIVTSVNRLVRGNLLEIGLGNVTRPRHVDPQFSVFMSKNIREKRQNDKREDPGR